MLKVMSFSADWCKPCQQMKPIINELAEEQPEVEFVSVDIEQDQETTMKFKVRSIPTFVVLKDDEVIATQHGAASKLKMESLLEA